ncbi:MAG: hypothetical protein HQL48_07765, partial [Gammaproteobacteria bacterium]|nr:hypothetical protein [Gammaproteobacteria bacterium]
GSPQLWAVPPIIARADLRFSDSSLLLVEAGGDRYRFSKVELRHQMRGERHYLSGSLQLPLRVGERFEVAAVVAGRSVATGVASGWSGSFYLRGESLETTPFTPVLNSHLAAYGIALGDGQVGGEFWGEVYSGDLTRLQGHFNSRGLSLRGEQRDLPLPPLAGDLLWAGDINGGKLRLQQLRSTGDGAEEILLPTTLALDYGEGQFGLALDRLDLALLNRYRSLLAERSPQWAGYRLAGVLRNFSTRIDGGALISLTTRFQALAVDSEKGLLLSGMSGRAGWRDSRLELQLDGESVALGLGDYYSQPLLLNRLQGMLWGQFRTGVDPGSGGDWHLWSNGLELASGDLDATLAGGVEFREEGGPQFDLVADFQAKRTDRLSTLIPDRFFGPDLTRWLRSALPGKGRVGDGWFQLQGAADRFPYLRHEGIFKVSLAARGVDLHYDPHWPQLSRLDGDLLFSGRSLWISGWRGQVLAGDITRARVHIANFERPELKVEATVQLRGRDLVTALHETPLRDWTGDIFKEASAEGEAELTLRLDLPLYLPLAQMERQLQLEGALTLNQMRLKLLPELTFDQLQGTLSFYRDHLSAEAVTAELFGGPVTLNIQPLSAAWQTRIEAQGVAEMAELSPLSPQGQWWPQLAGKVEWRGGIDLYPEEPEFAVLQLHSDLVALRSSLPHPLRKEGGVAWPSVLEYRFNRDGEGALALTLGEKLQLKAADVTGDRLPPRLHLHLGPGEATLPREEEVVVSGTLGTEPLQPVLWYSLLNDGDSQGLEYASPITIDLQQLRLQFPAQEGDSGGEQPWRLPRVRVDIRQFEVNERRLGRARLELLPEGERQLLHSLTLDSDALLLQGSGVWAPGSGSELNLTLKSDHFARLLDDLKVEHLFSKGVGQMGGRVHWSGSPLDFSWQRLRGSLNFQLKDSVLQGLNSNTGRVIGFFSLRALPQHLFLDFSSLKDEITFSEIGGDVQFENGNAVTRNMVMKSIPANILLTGRVGVVKEDLDIVYTVVPNISDTVPVAGALAMGPQVGAILLVLQKLFEKDINGATMVQYRAQGGWDAPVVRKLKREEMQ